MSNPDEMMNILKKNCDLNCERCRRAIESLNKLWIIIFGIPFTDEHCPLELFYDVKRAGHDAEALRLELEIFLKKMKTEG
jgi:hypothetical protein